MAEEAATIELPVTDQASATPSPVAEGAAAAAPPPLGSPEGSAAAAEAPKAEGDKAADTKAAGEPVDYAKALAEVKLPEGMTLDPTATKAGTELFAKHKLSSEAVKDLVSLYAQQQKAGADGNAKLFAAQVAEWKAAAAKAISPEDQGIAKVAVATVFPTELIAVLDTFGITSRADFVMAMTKLSKDGAIKDDKYVAGNAAAANGRTKDARSHFPNSPNMNP